MCSSRTKYGMRRWLDYHRLITERLQRRAFAVRRPETAVSLLRRRGFLTRLARISKVEDMAEGKEKEELTRDKASSRKCSLTRARPGARRGGSKRLNWSWQAPMLRAQ